MTSTAVFGVGCISKNKRPQCDTDKLIEGGDNANPQGVMYVSDPDASATLGAATAAFEIGDASAAASDTATLAAEELTGGVSFVTTLPTAVAATGNGAAPDIPTNEANTRRLRVSQGGVYHYDIDLVYTVGAVPNGAEVLRTGPTVLSNTTLTFYTGNAHSLSQTYGLPGDNGVSFTRHLHVAGNLRLSDQDQVGIFRHTVNAGNSTTFLAAQARLQLVRVSE